MLYCAKTKPESKFSKNSLPRRHCSVCFAIQGAMQGTVQRVVNTFVTSKSVRAQLLVIIGVRWDYLLSQEGSRHRGFSAFVFPSCFGVVSFRVS